MLFIRWILLGQFNFIGDSPKNILLIAHCNKLLLFSNLLRE